MERCCVYYKNQHSVQFVKTSKKRQTGITGAFIPESNPFPTFFAATLYWKTHQILTHPQLIIYIFLPRQLDFSKGFDPRRQKFVSLWNTWTPPQSMTNFLAFVPTFSENVKLPKEAGNRPTEDWQWQWLQHPTIGHRPWHVSYNNCSQRLIWLPNEEIIIMKNKTKKNWIDSLYII